MSAREAILGRIRKAKTGSAATTRADTASNRLNDHPEGIIPAAGLLEGKKRIDRFRQEAEKAGCSIVRVKSPHNVPKAVSTYLRDKNLPHAIRMGSDKRLRKMPWDGQKTLEVSVGPSMGEDLAGLSHAATAVAETGSVILTSGKDNPTTLNLLPEHHIIVVSRKDIADNLEAALSEIRKIGKGSMPRCVNIVTGPSRSADVEQTLVLGAHGPKAAHIILVDGE